MEMEQFTSLTAIAAPMPIRDVNTDDIFPLSEASPVYRNRPPGSTDDELMGRNCFAAWRWDDDCNPKPEFVLNRPPYDRARILIADANFGCGSSREMAVWALKGAGLRCVIAPSFGDIFYNNCFKNGLLPVRLAEAETARLMALASERAEPEFTVDLVSKTVSAPDGSVTSFQILEYHRQQLLLGQDEIAASLARMPAIRAFETRYAAERPWLRLSFD